MAKHYIQSFETGRWCVDHNPVDVKPGDVVAFSRAEDAAHFIDLKRAGYIGQFATMTDALHRLDVLMAEHEAAKAKAQAAQAAADAEALAAAQAAAASEPQGAGSDAAQDADAGKPSKRKK